MAGSEKIIFGVCFWIAQKFKIDPAIVRVALVVLAFFGGGGLALYLILWVVKMLSNE